MAPSISWSPVRAKVQLKLGIQRLRLLAAKKAQLAKVTRREIAGLLEKGKLETARIKVEGVMGEDSTVELLELLELYCELLLARFGLLELPGEIEGGISEAVIGIIHAAPRTELKELHLLRELLMSKFGRELAIASMENKDNFVSKRVTSKLAVTAIPDEIVDLYLHEIAKAYGIDWQPEGFQDPSASAVPTALAIPAEPIAASGAVPASPTKAAASFPPHPAALAPLPSTPTFPPEAPVAVIKTNLPPPPVVLQTKSAPNAEEDAFEALTKRFADLKKR